jgi:uncharacterized protein YjbI with pentapeptide repeats
MADEKQLELLAQGAEKWNQWRREYPQIRPDLSEASLVNADLSRANLDDCDLRSADLSKAQLSHASLIGACLDSATLTLADLLGAILNNALLNGANFFGAFLFGTRLKGATLTGANLLGANLMGADLSAAVLRSTNLMGANLQEANLTDTDFTKADLTGASLVGTRVEGAVFVDCHVHGIAAWSLQGQPRLQSNLLITSKGESAVMVSDLEAAQFSSLIRYGKRVPMVLDEAHPRFAVMIGRFRSDRKELLLRVQSELEKSNYIVVVMDIDKPSWSEFSQSISSFAEHARLMLVDLSAGRNVLSVTRQVLEAFPALPVQPLLEASSDLDISSIFGSSRTLETCRFRNLDELSDLLAARVLPSVEVGINE